MAQENHKGGENSDEVAYLIASEGEHWKNAKGGAQSWVCLVKEEGVECKRGPWKFRHHLANHLRIFHMMDLPKSKNIGRPPKPGSKKRKVNSKKMNLKVMGNPYKRARKELWKKEQAWMEEGEVHWKTLEDKAKVEFKIKRPPILATIIGQHVKALMGVKKFGEGVLDGGKCEILHNSQNLANLVVGSRHKRVSKSMKTFFMHKDWNTHEDERKVMVKKLIDWHREQAIRLPWKEGKEKWISRFLELKRTLYQMSNPTRMDRIEAACNAYSLEHGEGSNHGDNDNSNEDCLEHGQGSNHGDNDNSNEDFERNNDEVNDEDEDYEGSSSHGNNDNSQ